MNIAAKLRCAIYTRKSSEDGLDQSFNSLDAQREACEAYVRSQASLGWRVIPELYDDGGISGGTMERPALQRLLRDIKERRIDVVVVYKIDRLTRSLMDFSRIVDVFDRHDVSFVSITQQFNTTTSMGRLTLNVLLSFAQFEREVTAERIRDKVAASKKKGMWMGGPVPLGYRVSERKLIVDAAGAATITWLFNRYLDLKSLNDLSAEAAAGDLYWGNPGKASTVSFSRGKLRHLLTNPIYVGKVRHKDAVYDGEHEAIIEANLFGQVQALLARQAPPRRIAANIADQHLLGGLLFDENGQSLLTAHTQTRGKRYRYYVSRPDAPTEISREGATARTQQPRWRLPTSLIDPIVERHLHALLADKSQLSRWVEVYGDASNVASVLKTAGGIARQYSELRGPAARLLILRRIYKRILLDAESITFEIRVTTLISFLSLPNGQLDGFDAAADDDEHLVSISVPMRLKRRGNEARIVLEGTAQQGGQRDMQLINALAKAHLYLQALTDGSNLNIVRIAECYGVSGPDVSRLLPLAFLSPKITEAILTGRQSPDLTVARLTRMLELPNAWQEQHKLFEL